MVVLGINTEYLPSLAARLGCLDADRDSERAAMPSGKPSFFQTHLAAESDVSRAPDGLLHANEESANVACRRAGCEGKTSPTLGRGCEGLVGSRGGRLRKILLLARVEAEVEEVEGRGATERHDLNISAKGLSSAEGDDQPQESGEERETLTIIISHVDPPTLHQRLELFARALVRIAEHLRI